MLHKNWDLVTEEQRTRIELMKMQTTAAAGTGNEAVEDWIDAVTEEDPEEMPNDK